MYDLLVTGAKLLDIQTGKITENNSIAVTGECISKVIGSGESESLQARSVIDAGGRFVFPGFIDFHVHLFAHGSTFGLDAERLLSSGVTCAVDMGSAGWMNYPAMYKCDIAGKKLRLRTYINVSPIGQPGKGVSEPLNDELLSVSEIRRRINEFPGMIRGLKIRISKGIVKELGITPLVRAVEFGNELGLPVCVHTTDPPVEAREVAKILRAGDIYSHTYNGRGFTILDDIDSMIESQRRGVLFEVGNGKMNFNFTIAESALASGLFPDIISSDATPATFHNEDSPVMWDLSRVMSKFLNLGMSLADVIKSVTLTPAKVLGLDNFIGKVEAGYLADLVICSISDDVIKFSDAEGNTREGKRGFVPEVVILKGEKVFCG